MEKDEIRRAPRSGFTMMQGLLIVAVIAIVGFVIWRFFTRPTDDITDDITSVQGFQAARDADTMSMNPAEARSMTDVTVEFFTEIKSQYLFPEYTDDQRLNNGSDQYGPIAHIVPVDSVADWTIAQYAAAGTMGKLVGGIAIDDTMNIIGTTLPATYTTLNLRPGNNCFYLANSNGTAIGWSAFVVPADTTPGAEACPATHSVASPLSVLAVTDVTHNRREDVPPVARFHEGEKGTAKGRTYLGIKCDVSWCLVLPNGMAKADTLPPFHKKPGQSKHWLVRGWHDIQRLGVADASSTVTLDKDLEASVVPDDSLGLRDSTHFQKGWVRVATVQFTKRPDKPPYSDKWHFLQEANEISIRIDARSKTGWIGKVFSGQMDSSGNPIEYALVVNRDPHPGERLPGTARWAWRDKDEWIWVRCDEGCCWISPS